MRCAASQSASFLRANGATLYLSSSHQLSGRPGVSGERPTTFQGRAGECSTTSFTGVA